MQLLAWIWRGANQSNESYTRDLRAYYLRHHSHFDWLASLPLHGKRSTPVRYACLKTVHTNTVANEECACFFLGLPYSGFESCKFRIYSLMVYFIFTLTNHLSQHRKPTKWNQNQFNMKQRQYELVCHNSVIYSIICPCKDLDVNVGCWTSSSAQNFNISLEQGRN